MSSPVGHDVRAQEIVYYLNINISICICVVYIIEPVIINFDMILKNICRNNIGIFDVFSSSTPVRGIFMRIFSMSFCISLIIIK